MISTEQKQQIVHALAGVAIVFKGLDKNDHGNPMIALIFVVFGALLIAYAALHSRLHHTSFSRHFEVGVFGVEALIFGLTSVAYAVHHKTALPVCYLLLALAYVYMGWRRNRVLLSQQHAH